MCLTREDRPLVVYLCVVMCVVVGPVKIEGGRAVECLEIGREWYYGLVSMKKNHNDDYGLKQVYFAIFFVCVRVFYVY